MVSVKIRLKSSTANHGSKSVSKPMLVLELHQPPVSPCCLLVDITYDDTISTQKQLKYKLQEEMGELCTVRALGRGNSDIPPDAREAACFAALGWLWLHGESGAVQGVTGASREAMLGSLALP